MITSRIGIASLSLAILCALGQTVFSQTFIHPGGLHTLADLDRMKSNVLAGNHPWIDDWNKLITDSEAQTTYKAAAQANMGVSRQRADADAHAAYLNTIRWYISGDTNYAECAARICNEWSAAVNQVPTGTDIPGLSGIPIFDFALAGEVLRIYPGWKTSGFGTYTNMMVRYLYPVCHNFLAHHNDACISAYWANWDACNLGALIAMGVLCDDTNKFNEGVNYFKTGAGMGSISNAIPYLYAANMGQWQESGRDQEHAQLGVGLLGSACQVAWNQGLDLFGYSNNRLLAGAEYVAQYNLWKSVPYTYYNNCSSSKNFWPSINGRGRLDRPIWELIYNHYVARQGLSAPNTTAMAKVMRPERGNGDHFGYGTLTFTLNAAASPYPPSPIPATPANLTATAGISLVTLRWASSGDTAQGYNVRRSTTSGGPYTSIASWTARAEPGYTDTRVADGTTYYYVVAAINQSGTSANSAQASATPAAAGALPAGWVRQDIGVVASAGGASHASAGGNTFIVSGNGAGLGGAADSCSYACMPVTGDLALTGRLLINGRAKVGLMMRETLDANAKTLALTLGETGLRGTRFGTRASIGGSMSAQSGNDYTWTPVWYRLQRSGTTFTASHSPDGVAWFTVGSISVTVATNYYAGLAVCGGAAIFDNVTIEPRPPRQPD